MQYNLTCKVCEKQFDKLGSLHKHLKQHNYFLADYYVEFYQKRNKLTGNLLPFKNVETYFERDFLNRSQLNQWIQDAEEEEAKQYIRELIVSRVKNKNRDFLPFHLEIENCFLPKIDLIRKYFGSYSNLSKEVGLDILFDKPLSKDFFTAKLPSDLEILVDTREQKPLTFDFKSKDYKLAFGDYVLAGDYYNYTYVDRKSGTDFCGTLGKANLERFKRELELTKQMNAFMFIVVESSVEKIIKENKAFKRRISMDYILKNLRDITYEFPRNCQFVFTSTRKNSEYLIPRILYFGQKIWRTDLQYFIDHELARRQSEKKQFENQK